MYCLASPRILILAFLSFTICSCSYRYSRMSVLPDQLEEASGLYIENEDIFWLNNDSGGRPVLYAVNPAGELIDSMPIEGASNQDWEDLGYDNAGNVYVFDCGNNANKRDNLRIYKWEPASQSLDSITYRYPDQELFPPAPADRRFDAEGGFWFQDSLYIFSKDYLPNAKYRTSLYALPAQSGDYTAVKKGSRVMEKRVITAAAISPSGKRVALLSYLYRSRKIVPKSRGSVFLIEDFEGTDFLSGKIRKLDIPKVGIGRQFEAIDFLDENNLIVGAERTKINNPRLFKVKIRR